MNRQSSVSALILAAALVPAGAAAQMVSAADMGFVRTEVMRDFSYFETGYSITNRWSVGPAWYRIDGDGPTLDAFTANVTRLVWRENAEDWQANLYVGAGVGGMIVEDGPAEAVGAGLIQADWEDRDWHVMYQGQALFNDSRFLLSNTIHAGRALWHADYDEIAPWFYLRAGYITGRSHHVDFAPMLVLMYKSWVTEAGVDLNGNPVLGVRYLFSF